MRNNRIVKLVLVFVAMQALTGCAMYDSKFTCPDSRGARCAMLSRVDNMVDSGEIITVQQQGCKSKHCKLPQLPQQKLHGRHKVKLLKQNSKPYVENDGYVYLQE